MFLARMMKLRGSSHDGISYGVFFYFLIYSSIGRLAMERRRMRASSRFFIFLPRYPHSYFPG